MRHTSFRSPAGAAVAGTICLVLLAALVSGCAPQSPTPSGRVAAVEASATEGTPEAADIQPTAVAAETGTAAIAPPTDKPAEKPAGETVTVGSCDGEKTVQVAKHLQGQPLADALMDQWKRDHPEANWVTEQQEKHAFPPPADNSHVLKGGQGQDHTYGNYTERDVLTWAREAEKFVAEGSRIFHSGDALGSEVGVSCDMCHPHAANTHPETYPKFQPQLGRVALLRDMIDWCIENPVRGQHLDPNGPTMRALEAYIMAARKGVPMDYGKH